MSGADDLEAGKQSGAAEEIDDEERQGELREVKRSAFEEGERINNEEDKDVEGRNSSVPPTDSTDSKGENIGSSN